MSNLLRTNSGGLNISDSLTISQVEDLVNKQNINFVIPIEDALKNLGKIEIDYKYFDKIINGVSIETDINTSEKLYRIYCSDTFIGIGKIISGTNNNYLKIKNNFYRNKNENN